MSSSTIKETIPGIVIPDVFKEPDYVKSEIEIFKKSVQEDYVRNKVMNTKLIRKLLEKHIFNDKIQPRYPLNKKGVQYILNEMYSKFDEDEFQWRYLMLMRVSFFLSTYSPSSFTWNSLKLPDQFKPKKQAIIEKYNTDKEKDPTGSLTIADKAFNNLADEVLDFFRANQDEYPVVDLIDSGAKGGTSDIRKLLISIGLSINSAGEVNDVIGRSHAEGLTQTQFFNYSSQAIVSQYQKSVQTAIPGYLIRKLNTLMAGVVLSRTHDCGSKKYIKFKILSEEVLESFDGRLYKSMYGLSTINAQKDKDLIGETLSFRSPFECKSEDGICWTCYNPKFIARMDMKQNAKIGLLASTSSANMLVSLTLKAAHTGLSLNAEKIDMRHDIYEYSE